MIVPMIVMMLYGIIGGLMVTILLRCRRPDLWPALMALCGVYAVWVLCSLAIVTTGNDTVRWYIYKFSALGWATYPAAFLWFAMRITKTGSERFRMGIAALMASVTFTVSIINMLWPRSFITGFLQMSYGWHVIQTESYRIGPVYGAFLVYIVACAAGSVVLYIRWCQTATGKADLRRALTLMSGALVTVIFSCASSVRLIDFDFGNPSLAPVHSFAWFLALYVVTVFWGFEDESDQASISEVLSRMRELFILTNHEGIVLSMNAPARSLLGIWSGDDGKTSIRQIMPDLKLPQGDVAYEQMVALHKPEGSAVPARVRIDSRRNQYGERLGYIVMASVPDIGNLRESDNADNRLLSRLNEKTRISRVLLDHALRGVLFFGTDFRVNPDFSPSAAQILKYPNLAQADLKEAVFPSLEVGEWRSIHTLIEGIFNETRDWRVEAMMPMLPATTKIQDDVLRISWTLIPLDRETGERWLMLVIEPDEALMPSKKETTDERRLEMIVSILTKKQSFLDLIHDWSDFHSATLPRLLDESRSPRDCLNEIYRNIHTFKSSFARLGMMQTRDNLNSFEDSLMAILKGHVSESTCRQVITVLDPDGWTHQDLSVVHQLLGKEYLARWDTVEVERSVLDGLAHDMENLSHDQECIRITTRFREMYCIRILNELCDYKDYVLRLGREKLNMEPDFIVQGHDLMLDGRKYRLLLTSLMHVFNNTIGHGLEPVAERVALGKPAQARIECLVQRRGERLILEIADDGRGIDADRIRDGLRGRGLVELAEHGSDKEVLQTIFEPGFSTLLSADNLSGRGIGLFAVMHAVRQIDGNVEVQSKPGQYTRFVFDLPLNRGVGRENGGGNGDASRTEYGGGSRNLNIPEAIHENVGVGGK